MVACTGKPPQYLSASRFDYSQLLALAREDFAKNSTLTVSVTNWYRNGLVTTSPAIRSIGPVPEFPQTQGGQSFSKALFDMARREKMTLRDLYNITAAARGHWVICGSPKRVADILEDWFMNERADGFVIMPAYFPGAFDDFVDKVVPELQRRGLYRKEYSGTTLREHLGLERPKPYRRPELSAAAN